MKMKHSLREYEAEALRQLRCHEAKQACFIFHAP
jgi:hypothetical protein